MQSTTIGTQSWAVENLELKTFRNGDLIKQCQSAADWIAAAKNGTPAWCYYCIGSNEGYGYLYNAYAVLDDRNLAPQGWHIPSRAEFRTLWDTCGGESEAAVALKSKTNWVPYSPGTPSGGSGDYGFNWEPSGFRYSISGTCVAIGYKGYFWSSDSSTEKQGFVYVANTAEPWVQGQYISRGFGFPVRCIQD